MVSAQETVVLGQQLKDEISKTLQANQFVVADGIHVSVNGARVTLSGSVGTMTEKNLAEELARKIPGVNAVDSRIEVAGNAGASGQRGNTWLRIGIGAAAGLLAGSLYFVINRVLQKRSLFSKAKQKLRFW
jgi:hypothetical protein